MTHNTSALFVMLLLALVLGPAACKPTPTALSSPQPPTTDAITAAPTVTQAVTTAPATATPDDPYWPQRQHMVDRQLAGRDITNPVVLTAMGKVPREQFVPPLWRDMAYNDHALPIDFGQSISQPYIVATMTQLLALQPGDKVLEIGTGSGYQAAILAEVCDNVYTIEIIPQLAESARVTLDTEGYQAVISKQGDGYDGWPQYAPFDAIIVTAAPDHVPQPLINQLADGGRMVIPVGPPGGYQSLWLITRHGDEYRRVNWGGVRFVPFTREK